jgi:tRNA pseudouridine65 synthase
MNFRILYQDDFFLAIDKPAGFHVHPPEDSTHKISNLYNCLYLLKRQTGRYLYPVHRIDRATSGVLLFALQSETAKFLCQLFQKQTISKTYFCVVRGWTPESGEIDHPLKSETDPSLRIPALTHYRRIATLELPEAIGKYTSARYSLLRVEPQSGRKHQIRRHFAHLSYPLIGDTIYGNGEHNRFFREKLNIPKLLLKAYQISFIHPHTDLVVSIKSRWNKPWHQIFDLLGVCPWEQPPRFLQAQEGLNSFEEGIRFSELTKN